MALQPDPPNVIPNRKGSPGPARATAGRAAGIFYRWNIPIFLIGRKKSTFSATKIKKKTKKLKTKKKN